MPACQAVVAKAPNRCTLQQVALPAPGPGQALVETLYSVVSPGTERRKISGAAQDAFPFVPGYASSVRVIDPNGIAGLATGDVVVPGKANRIEGIASLWGGHCALQVIDGDRLFAVPNGVTPLQAAANKLCAIAHHGVVRAGLKQDDRVLVIGLGLLGQLVARIAAPRCRLTCIDLSEAAVETARHAGLDASRVDSDLKPAINNLAGTMDVVIDVTGVPSVPAKALEALIDLPWGDSVSQMPRYVVQGSYADDIVIPYQPAFRKEMVTLLPRDNGDEDRRAVLDLIASGALAIDDLITDVRDAADGVSAFEDLVHGRTGTLTTALKWAD